MTNDSIFQPKPEYLITSADETKAYIHPLRMQIINLLIPRAMTISQAAMKLNTHPANITRHFKLLAKTGLIKLVEKRDIGRNIEKYYHARAFHFEVRAQKEQMEDARSIGLEFLRQDLVVAQAQLKEDDPNELLCLLWNSKINASQFKKFAKELQQLIKKFQTTKAKQGNYYSLSLGLYPCQREDLPKGRIIIE